METKLCHGKSWKIVKITKCHGNFMENNFQPGQFSRFFKIIYIFKTKLVAMHNRFCENLNVIRYLQIYTKNVTKHHKLHV